MESGVVCLDERVVEGWVLCIGVLVFSGFRFVVLVFCRCGFLGLGVKVGLEICF